MGDEEMDNENKHASYSTSPLPQKKKTMQCASLKLLLFVDIKSYN
jgi:hypothetical protein